MHDAGVPSSRWAHLLTTRPGRVLAVALLLTVALLPLVIKLRIDSEVVDLFPQHSVEAQAFARFSRAFVAEQMLLVLVEGDDPEALRRFADQYAHALEGSPDVADVRWRVSSATGTLLKDHLEEAFTRYEQWGVTGLMIDFLDRDDQEMVEWQERVLQAAARHHLAVQFHGSYKPSGEQRTYPNLLNREGVLNLEYLKWDDRCTPQHDVDVAYTRALAGPLDYHLGGFRAVPRDRFTPREERPEILGTRAHQLALYVVFENPMPMVADDPDAYAGQAGFDFIEGVPTTWDETRFVAGEPGEYVVVARRSGDRWYLGGINNWTTRRVELPLAFLGPGRFQVDLRTDDRLDGSDPNQLLRRSETVAAGQSLDVALASGGGVVAVIRPE